METNYWNPTTRQYGTITEIRATGIMNGKMTAYHANYKSKSGPRSRIQFARRSKMRTA